MKQPFSLFAFLFLTLFFVVGSQNALYAQTTASLSAISPTLTELQPLLPTTTPIPQATVSFPALQKINDIASPPAATFSALPTASISADYCLNVPIIMYHHVEPIAIATQLGHPQLTEDNEMFEKHIKYLVEH